MGGVSGGLYLYQPERNVLELTAAIGIEQTVVGNTLHPGEGLSGRVWENGEPLAVDDYRHWAGRVPPYDELGLRATLGVPIFWGEQKLGVLVVWTCTPHLFSPSDTQVLQLFADQAAIAIENACLFEQVHVARERLESLSRQLIDAQEIERRHIARELHDEIGQALTVLKVNLQTIRRIADTPSLAPYLDGSIRTVESTLQQVRSLSLDLRPSLLDDLGLAPALRWYVDRQAQQAGIAAHFVSEPLPKRLPPEVEIACFRLVQEVLTNAIRHAGAKKMQIELRRSREALHLTIRDDGRGFDVQAKRKEVRRGESLGLLGMAKLMTRLPDDASPTEFRTMAESIYFSARGVYELLENLLAWSRLQRGRMEHEPQQLDLKKLTDGNTKLFAEVATDKGIRLESTIAAGVAVYADRNMLNTALRNLTSNALKFTPRGGRVTISALPDTADAGMVVVAVSDTGLGIRPADQAKLFRMDVTHSTRGTAEEKGTGLGLLICQEMVEKNGDRIWIESEGVPGQGTTVKFTLPLLQAPAGGWQVKADEVVTGRAQEEPEMEMLARLPPGERAVVHDLARRGDMLAIEEWTVHVETLGEEYAPLATKVRGLARDFEERRLLALVEQYVGQK